MPLVEDEKVKIRHHLGFLNVSQVATFALGTPAAVETQFIIEQAMNLVLESALTIVRKHISILDMIEEQMVCDLELLAVTKVGEIDVNEKEHQKLRIEYSRWQSSLANCLGVYPNPWDKRQDMGINVPVSS
jgi:hypothetical protein